MLPRSPHEHRRTATPLELLFDLVFVVAIAQAGRGSTTRLPSPTPLHGLASYAMVFFAIWWAWMNFTWFASAYDCDDVPYRLAAFVQIAGALILAAGVPAMFEHRVPNVAIVGGYVVMRLALVGQWLRAAASDPGAADHRPSLRPGDHPPAARVGGVCCSRRGCGPSGFVVFAVRWSCWCRSGRNGRRRRRGTRTTSPSDTG